VLALFSLVLRSIAQRHLIPWLLSPGANNYGDPYAKDDAPHCRLQRYLEQRRITTKASDCYYVSKFAKWQLFAAVEKCSAWRMKSAARV